ncbi:putative oxysterol binding protein [Operophtera brumata]|uniref:Putative oxysterol binding protein n=1 Tax=Operophtera brumata TaxID=104452 RepID=A0A0L7KMA9_OPEBR|nr:putative oxysterol binding protein [Operophtera brumata]
MTKSSSLGSHRPLSGQLYKYTNVVKGWQQRWFAVDSESGVLSYYLFDGPGDTIYSAIRFCFEMMKSSSLGSHRPLSGQLYKYTNVVKGWQQRWFAVDSESGVLSYYLFDGPGDTVQPGQPARGEAHLAAAVICPSDEDSRTFTINCASGDMLKLRATDARARQEWQAFDLVGIEIAGSKLCEAIRQR